MRCFDDLDFLLLGVRVEEEVEFRSGWGVECYGVRHLDGIDVNVEVGDKLLGGRGFAWGPRLVCRSLAGVSLLCWNDNTTVGRYRWTNS